MDIVHADQKLYLVFEFLDVDLKRYMENAHTKRVPMSAQIIQASTLSPRPAFRLFHQPCPLFGP